MYSAGMIGVLLWNVFSFLSNASIVASAWKACGVDPLQLFLHGKLVNLRTPGISRLV